MFTYVTLTGNVLEQTAQTEPVTIYYSNQRVPPRFNWPQTKLVASYSTRVRHAF